MPATQVTTQKNISNKVVDKADEIIEFQKNVSSTQTNSADSYFHKRLDPLGVTKENNKIALWQNDINNKEAHETILVNVPIFREVPDGIEIMVYTIDRLQVYYRRDGAKGTKKYSIIRLEKPIVRPDGSMMKYKLPKGGGTFPFFPPALVEKYEKKTLISTLYMVEGYFKAWKAALHGCDIVGLSSITHMKNTETGKLHPDIELLIKTCQVKKVVWLTDGDAIDITHKELTDGLDLSKRPKGFFNSISTFKDLFDDNEEIEKWWMYIDTDNILSHHKNLQREDVKCIDDLLITLDKKEKDIMADLLSLQPGNYFQKFNITHGTGKVYNHFHLRDVKDFYLFHVDRRPELKNIEFTFNGTRYQFNAETNECDVKIPGAAKMYFRVGDDYYKFVNIPNQYDQLERTFQSRKKGTIADDHGRNFGKYIPKYESFCNVPDHFNFQQVKHNCFNVYSPLDFVPDEDKCTEDDCPTIIEFIAHLFGNKKVSYKDPDTNEKIEYSTFDLALDYLQLLYQKPTQKLPILCLVSHENNTGKTTGANFLRMMLGANVAIVGNADLSNDFNAHWAIKGVVICDETKIDKQHVVEKIKSLSTARKIFMNAKGRGQVELDCFIKFILITNNEDSFIYATDDDIRYWVIKVPVLKKENTDILNQFNQEMPYFLSYLNERKMKTEKKNRMWFHLDLIRTEAFERVIEKSRSSLGKEIKLQLQDLFLRPELEMKDEIFMSRKNIIEVFKIPTQKYDSTYTEKVLKEELKIVVHHKFKVISGKLKGSKFSDEQKALEALRKANKDLPDEELLQLLEKVNINKSYNYPFINFDGKIEWKADNGKAYIIYRKDFVKKEDELERETENDDNEDEGSDELLF